MSLPFIRLPMSGVLQVNFKYYDQGFRKGRKKKKTPKKLKGPGNAAT